MNSFHNIHESSDNSILPFSFECKCMAHLSCESTADWRLRLLDQLQLSQGFGRCILSKECIFSLELIVPRQQVLYLLLEHFDFFPHREHQVTFDQILIAKTRSKKIDSSHTIYRRLQLQFMHVLAKAATQHINIFSFFEAGIGSAE